MKTALPPGPKPFFSFSNVINFRKDTLGFLNQLSKEYGDISFFKMGKQDMIFVNNPDLIKEIFITNSSKFIKGRALELAKVVLGEGLLTSEKEFHTRQRRIIQPSFNHKRINYYGTIMADYAEKYRDKWKDGEIIDIDKEMMNLTLDIVCKTLFDTDMESDTRLIQENLTVALEMFMEITNPFRAILSKLPIPKTLRFEKARKYLDETIMGIIQERRKSEHDRQDLLSILMKLHDEEGDKTGMTDRQIRDEVMTLFIAGHETTSNLLTWTFYLLSQNPEIEEKFYQELEQVLGKRLPTPEDIPNLPYTKKVLTESMRIYPPAWIVGRRNIEEYEIKGFKVKPMTVFLVSQYIMHHNPKYFPQPEVFNPDRWTEEFKGELPRFAYFPFGGGPRLCIGENFAWTEGTLLLSIIAQKWKMKWIPDHPVELSLLITLRPKNGMKMVLEKRK